MAGIENLLPLGRSDFSCITPKICDKDLYRLGLTGFAEEAVNRLLLRVHCKTKCGKSIALNFRILNLNGKFRNERIGRRQNSKRNLVVLGHGLEQLFLCSGKIEPTANREHRLDRQDESVLVLDILHGLGNIRLVPKPACVRRKPCYDGLAVLAAQITSVLGELDQIRGFPIEILIEGRREDIWRYVPTNGFRKSLILQEQFANLLDLIRL